MRRRQVCISIGCQHVGRVAACWHHPVGAPVLIPTARFPLSLRIPIGSRLQGIPRRRWPEDCSFYWAAARGCGKERGVGRGNTMNTETSWGEVVTALMTFVIIIFLWLTY
jgi:hypothetical protein